MDFIGKLHEWTFDTPQKYGAFHISFLLLTFIAAALLIIFFKDCKERTMKRIVLITWIILVFFEILKAFIMAYKYDHLEYAWGSFPFQFCETPLYVFPLLILSKNKKLQHILISFISTYVFFAGFALMVNPDSLFSVRIILSIRTMIQHGIQVVIGLFLFAWDRENLNLKTFFGGSIVFVILTSVAVILNFTLGRAKAPDYEVNMFLINKDYPTNLMILKRIQPHVPWIIFAFSYLLGFTFCAICSYFVEYGSLKFIEKIRIERERKLELEN